MLKRYKTCITGMRHTMHTLYGQVPQLEIQKSNNYVIYTNEYFILICEKLNAKYKFKINNKSYIEMLLVNILIIIYG